MILYALLVSDEKIYGLCFDLTTIDCRNEDPDPTGIPELIGSLPYVH